MAAREVLLEAGAGEIPGDHYLPASADLVLWGRLPCANDDAVLSVAAGDTVTFDTISHEGILEDQGRDPEAFFEPHGVPGVLADAVALAASDVRRDVAADGPHVVSRPVRVDGARPGDLLAVTLLETVRRAPYGVVSNRHGRGALPRDYPRGGAPAYSVVTHVRDTPGGPMGAIPLAPATEEEATFPLAPFLGIIGVAPDQDTRPHSVPPGPYGGNVDLNLLTVGATLYLPVQVDGALAYVGDPHFAQGCGEVALTALEAPLRATVRLDVIAREEALAAYGDLVGPLAETTDLLVPTGLDADLRIAMQNAVRAAIALLEARYGMDPRHAYAYLSAATDFEITQVVDLVTGVHAKIRKADFAGVSSGPGRG